MHLTMSQRLIYDSEKTIGGCVAVMCGIMTVDKPCAEDELIGAIREIYRTNYALNLRLDESENEPVLYEYLMDSLWFNNSFSCVPIRDIDHASPSK